MHLFLYFVFAGYICVHSVMIERMDMEHELSVIGLTRKSGQERRRNVPCLRRESFKCVNKTAPYISPTCYYD